MGNISKFQPMNKIHIVVCTVLVPPLSISLSLSLSLSLSVSLSRVPACSRQLCGHSRHGGESGEHQASRHSHRVPVSTLPGSAGECMYCVHVLCRVAVVVVSTNDIVT